MLMLTSWVDLERFDDTYHQHRGEEKYIALKIKSKAFTLKDPKSQNQVKKKILVGLNNEE